MGVNNIDIELDNSTYYAGQTINGQIKLTLDSPKKLRGIAVIFLGEARTEWREDRHFNERKQLETTYEVRYFKGQEQCLKVQQYVMGGKRGPETELPPGTHAYPITCDLPSSLPNSFEGELGHIRYTVQVILDEASFFGNDGKKVNFTVNAPIDLNDSSLSQPFDLKLQKSFLGLESDSGPLTVVTSIPQTGYASGQTLPITCEIDNASHVQLNAVQFALRKLVTYYSSNPRTEKRHTNKILAEVSTGPVEPRASGKFEQHIEIPETPQSITNSKIIALGYDLNVKCAVKGPHFKLSGKIPITLGSNRMYSTVPASSSGFWKVAESMEGTHYPNVPPPKQSLKMLKNNQNLCKGVAWRIPQIVHFLKFII